MLIYNAIWSAIGVESPLREEGIPIYRNCAYKWYWNVHRLSEAGDLLCLIWFFLLLLSLDFLSQCPPQPVLFCLKNDPIFFVFDDDHPGGGWMDFYFLCCFHNRQSILTHSLDQHPPVLIQYFFVFFGSLLLMGHLSTANMCSKLYKTINFMAI